MERPEADLVIEERRSLTETRSAWFSRCRLYRWKLSIVWDEAQPMLVAFMLNPSTADHMKNDPTVERMVQRAMRGGYGGLIVLNAFAWRETNRLKMLQQEDPVGRLNDTVILDVLREAKARGWTVMVGWGNEGGARGRSDEVIALLDRASVQAVCLKTCANGQPQHPLYIGYDEPLKPWPAA